MKFLQTSVLMSLLAAFAMGCTSSTALQSSETDDMYYSSADKTVRPQTAATTSESFSADEAANPEYSGQNGGGTVNNNYNYYDSDYSYASRSRTVRSPYRNWSYYDYGYYHDPYWYAPGAFITPYYSAAYCYPGMYDPFWGPAYYPYSGLTVSIGFGYGYGGFYGGHRPWGYNPYGGFYGGGYGYRNGYYQGFYEGYYANNNNYYGVNRRIVNYGPRGDRSRVPNTAPAGSGGRPAIAGGRQAVSQPAGGRTNVAGTSGNVNTGRPQRTADANQPGSATPGTVVNNGRPAQNTQNVQPQNYEFQEKPTRTNALPANQGTVATPQNNRPNIQAQPSQASQDRDPVVQQNNRPNVQAQPSQASQDREPAVQPNRPVYQSQPGLSRPNRVVNEQMPQPNLPAAKPQQQQNRGIFNRPARTSQPSAPVIRENNNSYSQPSRSESSSPSRSASPANSGGRPRR